MLASLRRSKKKQLVEYRKKLIIMESIRNYVHSRLCLKSYFYKKFFFLPEI